MLIFSYNVNFSETSSARPEIKALSSLQVWENGNITLQCTVATSMNVTLNWTWLCASKKTGDSNGGITSTMTFIAKREHDKAVCYCRAQSKTPKTKYNESSNGLTVTVYCKIRLLHNYTYEHETFTCSIILIFMM
jgi:hypothetical protein